MLINPLIMFLFNYLFFILITFVLSDKNELTNTLNDIKCGRPSIIFDECFKNDTELLQANKIPFTNEEINKKCNLFNHGMNCFYRYTNKCIDENERKIMNNEVQAAKQFFQFLCQDKKFQQEFLRHKDCFYHIQNDWNICSQHYENILKEEISQSYLQHKVLNSQFMQFCCARFGYENCIFTSAKYKCNKESSIFIRSITKILTTDKTFTNCDKIEKQLCSYNNKLFNKTNNNYIYIILLLFIINILLSV